MMKFTEILSPQHIRQGVVSSSKKTVLELAGCLLAEQVQLEDFNQLDCFTALLNREKLGCTAIGNGVAIPRSRLPYGDKPVCLFLQLASPIDYEAADHREVDLILAILVPEPLLESYTSVLAALTEQLKDKTLAKQLRSAQSAAEIWQIFESFDKHNDKSLEVTELRK